jgi:hypothetical protein
VHSIPWLTLRLFLGLLLVSVADAEEVVSAVTVVGVLSLDSSFPFASLSDLVSLPTVWLPLPLPLLSMTSSSSPASQFSGLVVGEGSHWTLRLRNGPVVRGSWGKGLREFAGRQS